MSDKLVCPECGESDWLVTLERACIWQPCSFTLADEKTSAFQDDQGREIEADWDAYDSEDVGDTETVGFACRGCFTVWETDGDSVPPIPFVTEAEYQAKAAEKADAAL